MKEDFFAQGFGEAQGIVFTKQQNQFLQSKLAFLDPRKTYKIPMGNVISLLKFSNIQTATIMKIIKICTSQNSNTVTYEQMKKIFRGVALKQNKIQPSKINIQANIPTPMPVFNDDSDDEQEQKPKQVSKVQRSSVPSNQPPMQKVEPQKPQNTPQQMDPLKMWDEYWKNLKTKNNLIDGAQVKKICANNNTNKNNLSKAWKLCNISEKGSLTKGQCFVFMNLINAPSIPDSLNKQMLDMIRKIQQTCGYKKPQTQQRTSSSSANIPSNTTKPKQMSASDVFGKFGQQSLFQKKSSAKVQEPIKNIAQQNNAMNLVSNFPAMTKNPSSSLQQKAQNLLRQSKTFQNDISKIAVDNQSFSNTLQFLQKNFNAMQQNFNQTQQRIANLKQGQKILNDRLNSVCFSMKRIIQKQSQCINSLMQNIHQQNQMNVQRIKVLENYTNQMNKIVDANIDNVKNQVTVSRRQQQNSFYQAQQKSQNLKQKLSNYQGMSSSFVANDNQSSSRVRQTVTFKDSDRNNRLNSSQNRKSDPFEDQHPHYEHNPTNQRPEAIKVQQPVRIPAQTMQQPLHQKSQDNIDIQHLTPEQKIKIKQMQLIQLVNYITPIKQEEYAGVVQRITSMTEQQMGTLYTRLYEMYKKKEQQKVNEPKQQFPNTDQFNTSQFINEDTLRNYKNQQGYFNK